MKKIFSFPSMTLLSLLLLLCCSAGIMAQNREKFVISARAGGVNAVTGQAIVHAKGETDWHQLMITDDLDSGDRVRTASDGRVEILLNPGSYLRIGGNSEVELTDNSLANLEVRLLRGTAIVEAMGSDGTDLMINISTPHAKLAIVRQGLYRLNVVPGDTTELIVRKGRVILNDSHTKVKGGTKVIFSGTSIAVAKLTKEEKKNEEQVEVWSKERAQTLAKANRRISDRMVNSAFASMRGINYSFFGLGNSGLWFYNAGVGCYTFLPFFYGWGSPYGSSYSTSVYNGVTSGGYFGNRGYNGGTSTSGGTSNGVSTSVTSGSAGTSGSSGPARTPPPTAGPRDPDSGARPRKIDMP